MSEYHTPVRSARYNNFGAFVGPLKLMDDDFEWYGGEDFVLIGPMAKGYVGLIVDAVRVTPKAIKGHAESWIEVSPFKNQAKRD